MKISIGADHAGYILKEEIKKYLESKNIEVIDYGTNSLESIDYPDYALPTAKAVADGICEFGILVCYTGIGMSMCANKVKGVRGALVGSLENATLTREHNNANVLCLGAKDTNTELALKIVETFINTEFTHGRHERRVNKVMCIENE